MDEGRGIHLLSRAVVVDGEGPLKAWAERAVRKDPDIRWIIGNYVEADNANDNGHIFPLADLWAAQRTIANKPLNMMHRDHYIVGSFADAQLLGATGNPLTSEEAHETDETSHPYVEAVAGMWHTRFPEEYFNIQRAHKEGTLFFSMEAIPAEVSCPSCDHRAAFAGVESDTYCAHMSGAVAPKILHDAVFAGGAIIIPPVRPGWSRADIKTISNSLNTTDTEAVFQQIAAQADHLDTQEWERLMGEVLLLWDREFPPEQRRKMAKQGTAMPDGSYPIANAKDLRNAIQAVGRAKNPGPVKQHIKKRAKALGLTDLIPEGW